MENNPLKQLLGSTTAIPALSDSLDGPPPTGVL